PRSTLFPYTTLFRFSRHNHDLAVVLFEIEAFEVLRGKYGESGLSRMLREFVAVIRSKTRRVNTLARIKDGQFCLVIPEADRAIRSEEHTSELQSRFDL